MYLVEIKRWVDSEIQTIVVEEIEELIDILKTLQDPSMCCNLTSVKFINEISGKDWLKEYKIEPDDLVCGN